MIFRVSIKEYETWVIYEYIYAEDYAHARSLACERIAKHFHWKERAKRCDHRNYRTEPLSQSLIEKMLDDTWWDRNNLHLKQSFSRAWWSETDGNNY
ncbi:MAG: hypothetical protein ACP5N7_06460 [Candidatus Pacearchaeota archaeon]